ncbi:uncharacterized protein C8Q71DRAFT_689048, partial [Rhodofomes roseus]
MLTTAKRYNASFAAIKLDKGLKGQLPVWYHISVKKQLCQLDNTKLSKCLCLNHRVATVTDLVQASRHEAPIEANHDGGIKNCTCNICNEDRRRGCTDPLKCREAARRLLLNIDDKWNPTARSPDDNLTLTRRRKEANVEAKETKGAVTFNPSVTEQGGIKEALRVFIDEENIMNPPAIQLHKGISIREERCKAY